VLGAPRDLALSRSTMDEGERWLQRIYGPDRFVSLQKRHIEVADAGDSNLAVIDQPFHRTLKHLRPWAYFIGPMKLVKNVQVRTLLPYRSY
jgi:hypothetical protein